MSRRAAARATGGTGSPLATAPGKILLAGEYAVLHGHTAVVMAVDRRVSARAGAAPEPPSPFLEAAARCVAEQFGTDSAAARAARTVAADSTALALGGSKLGLGSSAAATVAAVACAVAHAGEWRERVGRPLVHRLAHRAHGAAQRLRGARGSGADVAAAVHGGLLAVRASQKAGRPDLEEPLELRRLGLPAGLHLVPVWTGTPAATPDLICAIETLRTGAPDRHARCIDAIATAARSLVEALAHGDAAAALAAIDRAGAATAALGQAAAVPLTGPVHDHLLALARAAGGTAKPTGAGAGDLALAAFLDPGDAARFRTALAREGFPLLELALDPRGVQIQTPDRTAAS